ncbi:MAG: methyltransferase domain-containing protein, partial [Nitrospinota bacterium]
MIVSRSTPSSIWLCASTKYSSLAIVGAGMDSFLAAHFTGSEGRVIGVDMTPGMLAKARAAAGEGEFGHLEFKEGLAEELPVPDGWA